ncbi:MAG TPA: lipid-binding SYLF domain-containing protein, partial [Candidatus Polarisedimenticolia bacterium]|nr:lipid-binding SYLF domain-containing protein [Candidatus Polarisedimenticolia bacterium]
QKDGTMSAPAFFTMGGPSIGWQAGIQEADLVLLVMNPEGVNKLLQDHFTIGGEASAAAGPVGRTAQAGTDLQLHAQLLTWSRSRGLFAGVSLEGMVIKQNKSATEDFYGRPIDAKDILVNNTVQVPAAAKSFVNSTTQVARRSS